MYHSAITVTAIIFIIVSIVITVHGYFSVRHTLMQLDRMLDRAIAGDFSAEQIDESMFSALEFKLARYLDASAVSARNTALEKERLQILLSDISHQTRTPIANLRLYSELLQEQALDEESRGYVNAVSIQTQKLDFLISSLVKMSRLETGVLSLHPNDGPVMPLLTKALAEFAQAASAKGLFLRLIPPKSGTEPHAFFDEKWTLEAICNLLDNAVKYTESGGITVKVIPFELFCRIEIEDTGIGIDEEEHAQVFSRFYRSRHVADAQGVGVGLYLAREIIAKEGGYIKLKSAPGKGSVFAVCLPVKAPNLTKPKDFFA
ncbi:MAG: HAMP domain-containing histidine kinase [Lachnospiraceae bacterium]|nr:HAMP domain-containing histidine kinase [Lachnospiraceae bacterium]